MNRENHHWYSPRLQQELGITVYGYYGHPILAFPTSDGDEWEYETHGMIDALVHHIDAGRVKIFCVSSLEQQSWLNRQAHPRHRSYIQAMFDAYVALEVVPFIHDHCRTPGIPIATSGVAFGAYQAANALLKHPERFRKCIAQSGFYDVRGFMEGQFDDNLYFNNPVEYMPNLTDEWYLTQLAECHVYLSTGSGPGEDPEPSRRLAEILEAKRIPVTLDDWGQGAGHGWAHWKRQMDLYIGRLF